MLTKSSLVCKRANDFLLKQITQIDADFYGRAPLRTFLSSLTSSNPATGLIATDLHRWTQIDQIKINKNLRQSA